MAGEVSPLPPNGSYRMATAERGDSVSTPTITPEWQDVAERPLPNPHEAKSAKEISRVLAILDEIENREDETP